MYVARNLSGRCAAGESVVRGGQVARSKVSSPRRDVVMWPVVRLCASHTLCGVPYFLCSCVLLCARRDICRLLSHISSEVITCKVLAEVCVV